LQYFLSVTARSVSDAAVSVLFPSIDKLRQRFFVTSLLRKTGKGGKLRAEILHFAWNNKKQHFDYFTYFFYTPHWYNKAEKRETSSIVIID
jgi:hypothetical protein